MIRFFVMFLLFAGMANAGEIEDNLKKNLPNTSVERIKKSKLPGIYEVQVGKNIFYTDKDARYLLFGHLFDVVQARDITADSLEKINRIKWSDLPLEHAIVSGPKKGLKIAVFTDPDCPFCKNLEKTLMNKRDFRVYTFLFPLTQLHPDAYEKSKSIWCAKDKHKALIDVMLEGKTLPKGTCNTPIDANIKLAQKLNVTGTPTLFTEDGRRKSGVRDYQSLLRWVEQNDE